MSIVIGEGADRLNGSFRGRTRFFQYARPAVIGLTVLLISGAYLGFVYRRNHPGPRAGTRIRGAAEQNAILLGERIERAARWRKELERDNKLGLQGRKISLAPKTTGILQIDLPKGWIGEQRREIGIGWEISFSTTDKSEALLQPVDGVPKGRGKWSSKSWATLAFHEDRMPIWEAAVFGAAMQERPRLPFFMLDAQVLARGAKREYLVSKVRLSSFSPSIDYNKVGWNGLIVWDSVYTMNLRASADFREEFFLSVLESAQLIKNGACPTTLECQR